jgi:hypothetical protein
MSVNLKVTVPEGRLAMRFSLPGCVAQSQVSGSEDPEAGEVSGRLRLRLSGRLAIGSLDLPPPARRVKSTKLLMEGQG